MAENILDENALEEANKRYRDEVERRTGKTPEILYQEREQRMRDCVALKVPDRVPVVLFTSYYPFQHVGLPVSASFYEPEKYRDAYIQTLLDYNPDGVFAAYGAVSGLAQELLGETMYSWAGGPFPENQGVQFREKVTMFEDEYDIFINDPGDFALRYYLPRRYKSLEALASLPPLSSLLGLSPGIALSYSFLNPDLMAAFESLRKAGEEQSKFKNCHAEVGKLLGVPPFIDMSVGALTNPPFHTIINVLRGLKGTIQDMFKRPEKLQAAMEKLLEWGLLHTPTAPPEEFGFKRVQAGGNHFSSEEFMSRKHFDTFVWPTWRDSLLGLIDRGYIPRWLMEGTNNDRIEPFLDIPRGKAIVHFEKVDMAKAKDVLNDHLCIAGNVPINLLCLGTPQEVEDYCKYLIQTCGKNGGFILTSGASVDDAKPENIKAMMDSVEKYGRYD